VTANQDAKLLTLTLLFSVPELHELTINDLQLTWGMLLNLIMTALFPLSRIFVNQFSKIMEASCKPNASHFFQVRISRLRLKFCVSFSVKFFDLKWPFCLC